MQEHALPFSFAASHALQQQQAAGDLPPTPASTHARVAPPHPHGRVGVCAVGQQELRHLQKPLAAGLDQRGAPLLQGGRRRERGGKGAMRTAGRVCGARGDEESRGGRRPGRNTFFETLLCVHQCGLIGLWCRPKTHVTMHARCSLCLENTHAHTYMCNLLPACRSSSPTHPPRPYRPAPLLATPSSVLHSAPLP